MGVPRFITLMLLYSVYANKKKSMFTCHVSAHLTLMSSEMEQPVVANIMRLRRDSLRSFRPGGLIRFTEAYVEHEQFLLSINGAN